MGVKLMDGSEVHAGAVVNCLGPWFGVLSQGVTTSTQMVPTRIQVAHMSIKEEQHLSLPFIADSYGASGIYCMPRRANKQLVFGSVDHRFESETVPDPDKLDTSLDAEVQADYVSCLLHRIPSLPSRGKIMGFSSMYTINTDDVHPVIGESSVQGFFLCNGFSGHGFKLAPAVGSMVTQQILGGNAVNGASRLAEWQTSVPLNYLSASRAPLGVAAKTVFA
mmetsp:Transcript_10013/g.24753  ORF Transcript_10013/g.24753 Transcript_10013/m.24753 type:complete len:221 (+) Transcript_10013:1-663(+)